MDLKFGLAVKVLVKGDIWIMVPHLGSKTHIVCFMMKYLQAYMPGYYFKAKFDKFDHRWQCTEI